ncbi:MAG: dihydroneopterin aldolase [Myxococcota bacterium]
MESNTIYIRDLKVACIIGVHAHEREAPQTLVINVKLHLSNLRARCSDKLEDTVDYSKLEQVLVETAQTSRSQLIEKLAQVLADACLAFDSRIKSIEVDLEKPACLKNARSAGINVVSYQMSPRP